MKKAVAHLIPFIEAGEARRAGVATAKDTNGKIVMATVKGDVHDIGKNIVGVVLQCNNYEVVDLGVMVPRAEDPRHGRARSSADIIGLSGPDHARRSTRWSTSPPRCSARASTIPLLIGGATTSRAHTAVKIDPQLRRPGGLGQGRLPLGADRRRAALRRPARASCWPTSKADYDSLRARHAAKTRPAAGRRSRRPGPTRPRSTGRLPPAAAAPARCSRTTAVSTVVGAAGDPARRVLRGLRPRRAARVHRLAAVLQRLGDEGRGSPTSSTTRRPGEAARKLYDDAQAMLDTDRSRRSGSRAHGVDRVLPGQRGRRRHRGLHRRRPQPRCSPRCTTCASRASTARACPTASLADFVAPRGDRAARLRRRASR